jgi:hypothetical protein
MPRPHPPDESGQAAVEFVLLLPVLAAILALSWQAMIAGHAVWAVGAAARAAARAAALGADPAAAARANLPARLERGLRVRDLAAGAVDVSVRLPSVVPGLRLGRVRAAGRFRSQVASP